MPDEGRPRRLFFWLPCNLLLAVSLLGLEGNPLGLGLGALGHDEGQHTVLQVRAHVIGVDVIGHGERPTESSITALGGEVALALLALLAVALATDRQPVAGDRDVEI